MQTKFFEVQISVRRTVKNSKIQTLIFLLLCPILYSVYPACWCVSWGAPGPWRCSAPTVSYSILYTQPVDVSLEVLQVCGAALLLLCPILYSVLYTQPVNVSLEVLQVCGAAPCSYCVLYCTQSVDVSLEVLQVRGAALLLLLQLVNVPEDSVQLIPILRPGSTYFYH